MSIVRSIAEVLREHPPLHPAGERRDPEGRGERHVDDVHRAPLEQEPDARGVDHERERDEERRERVLPGLERRPVGVPPVIAAAANGESAVGGDTSESTA